MTWLDPLVPAIGGLLGWVFAIAFRAVAISRLARLASKTSTHVDDVVLASLRRPVVLWGALLGLQAGLAFSSYDPRSVDWLHRATVVLVVVSIAWTAGDIAAALVRVPPGAEGALPSARILSSALRASIVVLGILVALQTIGISVAPVLTALGVGGLAVGLALQDTLANLFAGFHILVSRQVRPGDFIQLSSGQQGFVQDISWRNTTVRQLSNNIVIVPNAELAKSVTLNYSLPDSEQAVLVEVGVSYDDDLPTVERITSEVAATVQREVPGAVREFAPFIRFHSFGDSSINFTVIMRGVAFTDNYLMKHEFVKRLASRYRAEGITIPFPQRFLHLAEPPEQVRRPDPTGSTGAPRR